MSNIIPFVSSSPPPMDEDQTFGWEDDDDDDFGNFASAPICGSSARVDDHDVKGEGGCVARWADAGFKSGGTTLNGSGSYSPENHTDDAEKIVPSDDSSSSSGADQDKTEVRSGGAADGDGENDFADFSDFQSGSHSVDKPHIDDLPLKTIPLQRLAEEAEGDMGIGKRTDSVMEKSRESTATDSGLFSTDMSPLPQSESMCISEGDKSTMHSDDETFSDIPQDSQSQSVSHHDQDQGQVIPDLRSDEDADCEDSENVHDKEPSQQSDMTTSPDQNDVQNIESGTAETLENEVSYADKKDNKEVIDVARRDNEEITNGIDTRNYDEMVGDADKQDSADGTLCQNEQTSAASAAWSSSEVERSDHQLSSALDPNHSTPEMNEEAESNPAILDSAKEVSEHIPQSNTDLPASSLTQESSDSLFCNNKSLLEDQNNTDGGDDDDDEWAAFESPPSFLTEAKEDTEGQQEEPEDLVLRKDSIHFDDEDLSGASNEDVSSEDKRSTKNSEEEGVEGESKAESAMTKSSSDDDTERCAEDIPEDQTDVHCGSVVHSEAGSADWEQTSALKGGDGAYSEDDDFGDFHSEAVPTQATSPPEGNIHTSEDDKDMAKQSSAETSQENGEDDFGNFSSTRATSGMGDDDGDDNNDFGDLNSGSQTKGATVTKADGVDFGAFSSKSAETATAGGDDFGAFSSQPEIESSGSGWADFGDPAQSSQPDGNGGGDDFGNFAESEKAAPARDSFSEVSTAPVNANLPSSGASLSSGNVREKKIKTALTSCFSVHESAQQQASGIFSNDMEPSEADSDSSDMLGVLETILEYGMQYRTVCQQTWQVVQHPSRNDPRVKLWSLLQDMDGSPAVIYQWGKSKTNSHVFHTLHIDTQNMLIGLKKRSVPIFATGLSLLEPIRGGRKDRETGVQPMASMLAPTQVNSSSQEAERRAQDIPAVDFDWSTSGLTNPLTSHSLDLDFLVAQDSQSSDKPSVFESELLDAPRSSVKSSHQPLEDILKSVKPTSVRSRRHDDDPATSHMSVEAMRVLGSLPDLTFMQSKVLMFPIKN